MVDIHSHILPSIDDGSDSTEESLLMLENAYKCGTTHIVLTPHYLNDAQCRFDVKKSDIEGAFSLVLAAKEKVGLPIEIYLGAEHFGVTDIARLASNGELVTINGSRYVLVEFDFDDDIHRVSFVSGAIVSSGYVPIIAHPERYAFLQNDPSLAFSLLEKGCLFQVNKGSPLGKYGFHPQALSKWLLDNHLAHFVASDCHSPYQRTPDMRQAHEMLTYRFGSAYVERIFEENPLRAINNEPIQFG